MIFSRKILFLLVFTLAPSARAQYQHGSWWGFSYSFLQLKTSEVASSEVGHIPMLGGEVGVGFSQNLALSLAANYGTDSLSFSGTNVLGATTNQWLPVSLLQARVDGMYMLQSLYFNVGYGYRVFSDSLSGSHTRVIRTDFLPLGVYYISPPFYLHAEYRRYISGNEDVQNLTGGRHDVSMSQGGGNCYALEAGWLLGRPLGLKINLQYAVWNLDTSDVAFDGVESIYEPSSQTTEISLGMGLVF